MSYCRLKLAVVALEVLEDQGLVVTVVVATSPRQLGVALVATKVTQTPVAAVVVVAMPR